MIKQFSSVKYVGEPGTGEYSFLQPGATLLVRSVDHEAGTVYVQSPWDNCDRTTLDITEVEEKRR